MLKITAQAAAMWAIITLTPVSVLRLALYITHTPVTDESMYPVFLGFSALAATITTTISVLRKLGY